MASKFDLHDVDEKEDTTVDHPSIDESPSLDPEKGQHADAPIDGTVPAAARPYNGIRWSAICVSVYMMAFLYGLDTTIVADIQSFTVASFGEVEKLGWLGIGFPLGSVATILSWGKAYGMFDVKWLYIASLVMFEAGSALCGAAPNMNAEIVGRVWAGVGGAGIYLGGLNILALNTSLKERPLYTSGIGVSWGIGAILGPVIGGAFADSSATWRWAFYINLVLFALVAPTLIFVLDSFQPQPGKSLTQRLREMDWLGVVLQAAMLTLFVLPLTLGGATWSWIEARSIVLYCVFFAVAIAFALSQAFCILTTPENRVFPLDLLAQRDVILQLISMSCLSTILYVPIYYIPLQFSFVYGYTGIQSAIALLPFICVAISSVMLNGTMMPAFGYYKPWFLASFIFAIAGGASIYAVLDASTPKATIYGLSVLLAIGSGLAQQAAYSVVASKVPLSRMADAIGLTNMAQIGSTVIALAISSAIFQNVGFSKGSGALQGLDFTAADIRAALTGAKSTVFTTVSDEVRARVLEAIVKSIADIYIMLIAAGALGLVCSLFMKKEKLFMG